MSTHLFNRLETVNYLIKSRSTGTPKALAKRLGMSVRALYDFLDVMKDLGAPIYYCKTRKTYYYKEKGSFEVRFKKEVQKTFQEEREEEALKSTLSLLAEEDFPIDSDLILMLSREEGER